MKCTVEADEAVVRIEDHGRGIPASMLPHVFDLLAQAHEPEPTRREGLGLGLSIVKHLAQSMNGKVTVESEAGKGSAFTVELPLA